MDVMARADGSKGPAEEAVDQLLNQGFLDELMDRVDEGGVQLTGEGGFLPELVKRVLEAGLHAELTGHLGYEKHDPTGSGSGNSRNGSTPKRLGTEVGDLDLATPRDRNGSFDPRLVPKGQRRVGGLSDMIISLYSGGMTIRDIQSHLERTLGTELSHETIANITDAVGEEVKAWQTRPLEPVYPILYLDALMVKVRDNHQVRNKAAHIAVGVDVDGIKHVLGIWVQTAEGAKFWAGVLAELRNRGVHDVLIACCDGLTGFPEAIEATWPNTVVQTCVVHLIRASMRFISYNDRKAAAARCGRSTPRRPSTRRPGSWTSSRARPGARSIRPRSGSGAMRGSGSSRSWSSRPRFARSSTPPTASSR
jgi:putative transposase